MKITITSNFHYARHRFLTPGDYRVPADVDQRIADAAMKAGVAVRRDNDEKPARRMRKGPAPENKMLDVSDRDDKAALD